jgi:putative glutamine amidotransferase
MREAYVRAVARAGGIPVLVPADLAENEWSALRTRLDGVLLTGGGDIEPALFNGRPHARIYDIDPQRDQLEIGLVRMAAQSAWPFMGICRGHQVINVALGGTLFTDLADQFTPDRHDWYPNIPRDYLAHPVHLDENSLLAKLFASTDIQVNSLHHQAVEQVAPSLKAVGWSPDNVVEAIELPGHPFGLGVQWHPECLPDSPLMQSLFQKFIETAGQKA